MRRRDFLKVVAGAALGWSVSPRLAAAPAIKQAFDRVSLGTLTVSRLALGTGTAGVGGSSRQSERFGINGIADLFENAYHHGVTFWDSADQYGSHPHLKAALSRVPREKITILTKTHASTAREMQSDLDRFRRELGTDYIDIILLHCMMRGDWPQHKAGAMKVLSAARGSGVIRMHGVSCHSLSALEAAAESEWVQVDLARINPFGRSMDAAPERIVPVLQKMKARGKGVIGMKIFGGGSLRNRAQECLRYVLGLDCVDCFTIGCESEQEFRSLLATIPAESTRRYG
jgi:predicted aldo/keto reductase-like oxidoreductase